MAETLCYGVPPEGAHHRTHCGLLYITLNGDKSEDRYKSRIERGVIVGAGRSTKGAPLGRSPL